VTPENRRRNVASELERADTCVNEAQQLQGAALPYGAASRAYYAVFHAARALLFSIGVEASSHKGVVSLLGEHFVRSGQLSAPMGRLVSRMQRDREDADYSTGAVFTTEETARMIADAEAFVAEARRLIQDRRPDEGRPSR
jgi:uncharacterized protein (UPF0332 family)